MAEPLAVVWSRPLPDGVAPSTVTVSRDAAGRWHVSLVCDDAGIQPLPAVESVVGIDVGIMSLVTLSTGEKILNPRHERADRRGWRRRSARWPARRRARRIGRRPGSGLPGSMPGSPTGAGTICTS